MKIFDMADIFISYSRMDRERVIPIANALVDQGWSGEKING